MSNLQPVSPSEEKLTAALLMLVKAMYESDHGRGALYTGDFKMEINNLASTIFEVVPEQPPTQWAYEQACKALHRWRDRAQSLFNAVFEEYRFCHYWDNENFTCRGGFPEECPRPYDRDICKAVIAYHESLAKERENNETTMPRR